MRKLKGYGGYKGQLPFKCFNYGRIEHVVSKSPYKEDSGDEVEDHSRK